MKTRQLGFALALTGAIVAGCGQSGTQTVTAPDGTKVETSRDGSTMTIETPDGGTASVGQGTVVTEAMLTVPIYPGSTAEASGDLKVETPTEKSYLSTRKTEDDPAKVQAFYESKVAGLKFNKFDVAGDVTVMAETKRDDGARIVVTAARKKGETTTTVTIGYGWEAKK